MLNVINDTVNCMEFPCAIASLIMLALLGKSRKCFVWFTAAILLMMFWRRYIVVYSTRYSSIFLFFFFIVLAFFLADHKSSPKIKAGVTVLFVLVFLIFNFVKFGSSFRNNYIFDAQESVERINDETKDMLVLIHPKEFNRLGDDNKILYFSSLDGVMREYSQWGSKVCVLSPEELSTQNITGNSFFENRIRKINSFFKNRSHSSHLNIYLLNSFQAVYNPSDYSFPKDNSIPNGDMEEIENKETIKKQLKYLSSNKISFYDFDSVKLPKHDIMLVTWGKLSNENYPEVFADSENPICGKYSLNVKLKDTSDYGIYFLNRVPASSGKLSFLIKRISGSGTLILNRYNYFPDKDGIYSPPDSLYRIQISDDLPHEIVYYINRANSQDKESLFYLSGANIHFLIDNISFTQDM